MMAFEKLLTVSIAAYNVEGTIQRALDSLLQPEIVDKIEIFVVDDGGIDNTIDIAKKYSKKYPKTVFPIHKENGGYGSTINYSIEKAKGKYFKQLDGDDWFISENFIEFVKLLEIINSDCILTDVVDYNANTCVQVINEKYSSMNEGNYYFSDTKLEAVLTMHGTTLKTSVLKENKIRIIEHCFYSDTELVVLPMQYLDTFYIWKKPLYVYVSGSEGQSMSIAGIRKHYKDHDKVFWELVNAYCKICISEVNKRDLVFARIKKEAIIHFKFLLLLDISNKHFIELKNFGNRIKYHFSELYYVLIKERRMIRIMWGTNYLTYPLLSKKIKREYKINRKRKLNASNES
ncbi:glycosyltransferase family 2 protein [Holdemania massiliensis]|uniref:glycosyltransferase family 2 protein n=1 Tax=Holdemania massiliensis TaxID=1468449 RepID=UPI002675CC9B|nr:glycosyltransferase family 2 protein [Holdemania massiliensis]